MNESHPSPANSKPDLSQSPFRQRFQLKKKELKYLQHKTLAVVMQHAQRFVEERLASATPANDGQQTPMRGHPVFIAQHATATCCRSCLWKWHQIPKGRRLRDDEQEQILITIREWLRQQLGDGEQRTRQIQGELFSKKRLD
ncbi:MAG: DUF4186 domain-containing protein [Planctomycetaceae bacterium]|nr:DUF4186 domain-containing protein [Planctomycetaceae bacterium]